MQISGGIRFLPLYGESGAGKSCAAREISTHIPNVLTFTLHRDEIESKDQLFNRIDREHEINPNKILIAVIDEYEENVADRERIPTQFVEYLSLLDRRTLQKIPLIVIWLTTSIEFQSLLVAATSRNKRILLDDSFAIQGPRKDNWPQIIQETFSFHNSEKPLADYGILFEDLSDIATRNKTIGSAIQGVGNKLMEYLQSVQNLSEYQVVIMWPVSDSLRNQRVMQFSRPREGYKLNWDAWFSELNKEDRQQLPLMEFNRTRLYFDVRVIPVRVADLHRLCLNLDNDTVVLASTYINRFKSTHFFRAVSDNWEDYDYNPVRERESQRSREAADWYSTVTNTPTRLGRRIAKIFRECGFSASYEENLTSEYGTVRADIFIDRPDAAKRK